jgi:hypothetical protein
MADRTFRCKTLKRDIDRSVEIDARRYLIGEQVFLPIKYGPVDRVLVFFGIKEPPFGESMWLVTEDTPDVVFLEKAEFSA